MTATPAQMNEFAHEITALIRRTLCLTGTAQPGWFRASVLNAEELTRIDAATWPIIERFAQRFSRP